MPFNLQGSNAGIRRVPRNSEPKMAAAGVRANLTFWCCYEFANPVATPNQLEMSKFLWSVCGREDQSRANVFVKINQCVSRHWLSKFCSTCRAKLCNIWKILEDSLHHWTILNPPNPSPLLTWCCDLRVRSSQPVLPMRSLTTDRGPGIAEKMELAKV